MAATRCEPFTLIFFTVLHPGETCDEVLFRWAHDFAFLSSVSETSSCWNLLEQRSVFAADIYINLLTGYDNGRSL